MGLVKALTFIASIAVLLSLVSCGGDESSTPLCVVSMQSNGGSLSISGIVSLPGPTISSNSAEIVFEPAVTSILSLSAISNNCVTIIYSATNLAAGTYTLKVNLYRSGVSTETSGDYSGYYNGTVSSPILDSSSATSISLTESLSLNFGLGTVQ